MQAIEGGCLCGAVRYVARSDPITTRSCWCRVCQYLAAGNASVNVVFPKDAVTITGELKDYASTADSGNRMHRRFCPTCGTQMFSESEAWFAHSRNVPTQSLRVTSNTSIPCAASAMVAVRGENVSARKPR